MVKIKVRILQDTSLLIQIDVLLTKLCIDLGAGNRLRMQQLQQADWTAQQIREKQLFKEQEKARDSAFAQQMNHFSKLLEEEQKNHAKVRRDMEIANKQANAQAAKEKRDRDIAWMAE